MSIAGLIVGAFRRWKLSVAIGVICVAAAAVAAVLMKPVYRSEVTVALSESSSGLGGLADLAGQFGGIAALAGLPIGRDEQKSEALGVLRSRLLVSRLIETQGLMPVLFAEKWDAAAKDWKAGTKPPTMGDALKLFANRVLQVREDMKSGLIIVRIDWGDRELAAKWAGQLVDLANDEMRRRTIEESAAALALLEREYEGAQSVSLRNAISNVMEAQMRNRAMAEVRKQFAFKVVDPPVVSDIDKRVRPTRTLIVILGAIIGAFLAVLVAAVLDGLQRLRSKPSG
jgi:uncharacterized protein involved in exopolysaccharide biosynthesis